MRSPTAASRPAETKRQPDMTGERANPFGNLDRFKPKAADPVSADDLPNVKTVAERSGFQSREAPHKRKRRGRRSGRTRAFTTKMTPDYHELVYQIADGEIDGRERLVSEVIEQALDALMQDIAPKTKRSGAG
ncbi:MAG: hypothetical protein AAF543_08345 [Pseudomonadota bacterium]